MTLSWETSLLQNSGTEEEELGVFHSLARGQRARLRAAVHVLAGLLVNSRAKRVEGWEEATEACKDSTFNGCTLCPFQGPGFRMVEFRAFIWVLFIFSTFPEIYFLELGDGKRPFATTIPKPFSCFFVFLVFLKTGSSCIVQSQFTIPPSPSLECCGF